MNLSHLNFDDDTSLWVLNNRSVRQTIEVNSKSGRGAIVLPKANVPIDVTLQLGRKQILNSPFFRKAKANRQIIVIPGDQAKQIFSKRDALEELAELMGGGNDNTFALDDKKQEPVSIDNSRNEASNVDLAIATIFAMPDERQMINQLKLMINHGKVDRSMFVVIAQKAIDEKHDKLYEYIKELAKE